MSWFIHDGHRNPVSDKPRCDLDRLSGRYLIFHGGSGRFPKWPIRVDEATAAFNRLPSQSVL